MERVKELQKRRAQNQSNIKANNCKLVLNMIRENLKTDISRADIAKSTGMSATSITRITDFLMESGLIRQAEAITNGTVGRNGIRLQVVADAVMTLGISIDSDYIGLCILNFADQFVAKKKIKLKEAGYQAEEILDIAYEGSQELCKEIDFDPKTISVVGISCIGNIDYRTGTVFFAPQFQWHKVELGKMAQKKFDLPVFVENDMKSSLIGLSHRRWDIRYDDVTYLSIGTGVGAAVMYGGNIVRGSDNAAGEVGHIILESSGRLCDCGCTGCVQTYLTKNNLIEQCREQGHELSDVSELYQSYREKEPWALAFVEKQAEYLATLLRNLVYMYNTRYILVGGVILSDFPELYQVAEKKVAGLLHENLRRGLKLERVAERDNSRAGAAFAAQENYMEQMLYAK